MTITLLSIWRIIIEDKSEVPFSDNCYKILYIYSKNAELRLAGAFALIKNSCLKTKYL